MIVFKAIRYKNFLGSGSYLTEVALDKAPLTVIVGKNGAGKSTILDALSFVLFNKPFRNINKNQLVNSVTKKKCAVEIVFQIGGDEYRVARGIKPNGFQIFKNDSLVPPDAANGDYQDYLERYILRCNHRSFCQVVVLGSASYVPFLELPAPQRRAIVENILDLEIFSVMNANLKKQVVETRDELVELEAQKGSLVRILKVIEESRRKQTEERDSVIAEHRKNIDEAKAAIADLSMELNDEASVQSELAIARQKVGKLISLKNEIEQDRLTVEIQREDLERKSDFYHNHVDCPTCRQKIPTEFKDEFVGVYEKAVADLGVVLAVHVSKSKQVKSELMEATETINRLTDMASANANVRRRIERFNDIIKMNEANIRFIEKAQTQAVNDDDFDGTNDQLQTVNRDIDAVKRRQNTEAILGKMLKDDGIKAKIIDQYVTIINELVNGFLYEMDFMCQFMLDSEFNETIKSQYRDDFTYASFSEGEKLRITLAVLLTWRELAKRRNSLWTNLLFFDEILDSSLDSEGIENFVTIIKHLTNGTNTFIISHNSNSIDIVDNVLTFKKVKGFSHLEDRNK